jgi:hypothetical protein
MAGPSIDAPGLARYAYEQSVGGQAVKVRCTPDKESVG